MSQCYQIQLKESVTRRVDDVDSVSYPIELTEILPVDEMTELLRQVLQDNGWTPSEGNANQLSKTGEAGETIVIDLDEMEATATLADEKQVTTEVSATGQAWDNELRAKQDARREMNEKAKATGDQIEEEARKALREQLREQLTESEDARMRELNEIMQQVYAESLKRKAREMGDILDMQESTGEDGNYELVIRVGQ